MRNTILGVLSLALGCAASAGNSVEGRGFEWVEVDNGGVSDASGADLTNYRTFDLYFNIGAQGALVGGFNMGYALNPSIDDPQPFLETDGRVFNHSVGGDFEPFADFIIDFPAIEFDTFATFGGMDTSGIPQSFDLTGDNNGELRGVWFTAGGMQLGAGERMWALRVTLTDFTYLRGMIQVGLGPGFITVPYFDVPNVPAPGAAGIFALAGLALAPRRRACRSGFHHGAR
jgi:hypothetical protein